MPHAAASEPSLELVELASRRTAPGILILTPSGCVVYMNRRGWEMLRRLNKSETSAAQGLMPKPVKDLCREVQQLSAPPAASKDWEQVQATRFLDGDPQPVLLRGFFLPGSSATQSRVLVLMETLARRELAAVHAKERFQLTDREHSVVERLARGWTNKEIAADLNITEPTVKAHIRHIMDKTKCTTRTGIVAQVLHLRNDVGA